ncbi:L-lactate dehydrogenase [Candidatus Izemoplasma sp. B36]|uniref:lactate/malate family dehydrogenase n=1 Tax=Candidatus Izemoplasma sp. B36 TaxID=3242468 RepID=UPI003556F09B
MDFKLLKHNNVFKRKVAIIGSGFVGSSIAYSLLIKECAREIVLIDINKDSSVGEALDIKHGIPYMGSAFVYSGEYKDAEDCDLIIITAGRNRRVGENRLEMAVDNIKIVKNVINQLEKHYTKGVIMIVTNPVDIITYKVSEWTNLPNGMVFGTGCILDSSRFVSVLSEYLSINPEMINGFIAGEHGESQFPAWTKITVAGMPVSEYCCTVGRPFDDEIKNRIVSKVKEMGSKIISYKGKTHYGIATCVTYLADAILNRRSTIASVSSAFEGEYGINYCALSVPSIVGGNGVEKRLVEKWDEKEFKCLKISEKRIIEVLNKFSE